MVIIRNIDTFRDGGTIAIQAYLSTYDMVKYGLTKTSPLITIDYASQSETKGKWFNGLKLNGGKEIVDSDFKNKVVNEIEKMIERENFILNKIKNGD